MKFSSFIILILVILVFGLVQGWIVLRKFGAPPQVTSEEATLMGVTTTVATPASGLMQEVAVTEGQHVSAGQKLFTLLIQSAADPTSETSLTINAQRAGIITNLMAASGTFINSNQQLATIVDNNPDVVHVEARLSVAPNKVAMIRPVLNASIEADYLNNGHAIPAIVEAVDPMYDAKSRTIGIRLRLLQPPTELSHLPLGLPVTAHVYLSQDTMIENFWFTLSRRWLPFTQAQ